MGSLEPLRLRISKFLSNSSVQKYFQSHIFVTIYAQIVLYNFAQIYIMNFKFVGTPCTLVEPRILENLSFHFIESE